LTRESSYTALARLSHRNPVCPSVTRVDQSKTVQTKITKFLSLAACKTQILGTVSLKLFHEFERVYCEIGRQKNLRFLANKSPYFSNGAR